MNDADVRKGLTITEGTPSASLATHLNNPAMHKRAPISQAIADIRIAVEDLFCEYLTKHGRLSFPV